MQSPLPCQTCRSYKGARQICGNVQLKAPTFICSTASGRPCTSPFTVPCKTERGMRRMVGVQTSRKVISWTRGYLQEHRRRHAFGEQNGAGMKEARRLAVGIPCALLSASAAPRSSTAPLHRHGEQQHSTHLTWAVFMTYPTSPSDFAWSTVCARKNTPWTAGSIPTGASRRGYIAGRMQRCGERCSASQSLNCTLLNGSQGGGGGGGDGSGAGHTDLYRGLRSRRFCAFPRC